MRRVALVAVLAVTSAGCGITADDSFKEFGDDELPRELTTPTTTTTTTLPPVTVVVPTSEPEPATSTTLVATTPFQVYFVIGNQLQAQSIALSDATAAQVVAQLYQGPLQEGSVGLRTVVRAGLVREVRPPERGQLVVDLSGEVLQGTPAREQPLAIAQLALSLSGLPRIGQLRFLQDGEPLAVPVPARDGEFSEPGEPLVFDDFAPLLASTATAPVTTTSTSTTTTEAPPPTEPPPSGTTTPP
jgi:hypothetical protein